MSDGTYSPENYRLRAAEVRAKAENMTDPQTKQMMQEVAAGYEQMARSLEAVGASKPRQ